MASILRTPDARFAGLSDCSYQPKYMFIDDDVHGSLRVHYVDEGEVGRPVIVLLHGQATWSYSYRHMIPLLVNAGLRVIAPDFIGFGRSDKLSRSEDYSFQQHVDWLAAILTQLDVSNATGFFFDWGGYFGLPLAARQPDLFSRLVLVNTTLPRANGLLNALWIAWWRRHILKDPVFPVAAMVDRMTDTHLEPTTLQGLDAPFPDESFKAGPRAFPLLIPATGLNPATATNREAWQQLAQWTKPTLTLVSERLARRGFNPAEFHRHIPGTNNQPHATIANAGFFIIEDYPQLLAEHVLGFIQSSSVP
ncbi:haloalkane dehalogenase [Oceanicoccus sp. KOV_DT_Chl]|uniref:haloalkane dehalogenase n=1 Tax=Oceanicoccus sp. KOV_DT_Chl TaxID=1904639 RepID=UPI0013579483|nr:haloalkane dehalogenase [Oceanicoccus sp. KOV_DT_Chl]